jgi:hypothetical protein
MKQHTMKVIEQWKGREYELTFESEHATVLDVLDHAFFLQQDERKPVMNMPSMTAGDIIHHDNQWWMCSAVGWTEMTDEEVSKWKDSDAFSRSEMSMTEKLSPKVTHDD